MITSPGPAATEAFHRPERVFPAPLNAEPVAIAGPPIVPESRRSMLLQLGLPLIGSLSIVGFAFMYSNRLFIIVAGAIAAVSLVATLGLAVQQRRDERRRRARQRERYLAYLAAERERLEALALAQRERAETLHPAADAAWTLVNSRVRLWERRPHDADFLEVRIGNGDVPLVAPVDLDLGADPLVEHEEELLELAQELVGDVATLDGAPVTAPLAVLGSVAVVGDRTEGRALARHMLCELAALHAPDDLRLLAWFEPEAEDEWAWMKWLPHTRDSRLGGESGVRHAVGLTIDTDDLEVLLAQLLRPRLAHLERSRDAASEPPRFQPALVVVDGFDPAGPLEGLPMLREALARGRELGILTVCLVDTPDRVPAQIGARIELTGGWLAYTESGPNGRRERNVRAAAADVALCESLARRLAPLRLRGRRDEAERVESEGLLDLLELAAEDGHMLAAPIAIGDDGRPLVLDLKEAAEGGMGPHGLVVGATGSGKSELLRTLVAGLALEHDPEELAFVFVDYKGGATFAELEQLPHVVGTITNLERELTLVDRMREALLGELERRQRLLQEAGPFDRVRDYQQHRAANPDRGLEPLPSLLVIVDEFGELLTSRPDFLDFFVSAGRTGRSLGIHLLLSTQKLDEGRIRGLEGHLRYRICLRTFSPEESVIALGTRHAYELPPLPGLAYLRVDGALRRFKAAHVSRPFREHRPLVEEASVVRAFGVRGAEQELAIVRPARFEAGSVHDGGRTELQVAIDRANDAAAGRPSVRPVWLPPLPDALSLEAVVDLDEAPRRPGTAGWLSVPVGLVDRPRAQLQLPLELDFTSMGGHLAIVGAPRSGKSTLLQTLVAGLALTHDPADVQVYAVDLGGGGLHALAGLPHVGAVYGRDDRDRIRRLVRELHGIVAERSAAFRRHGLDGMLAYHRAQADGTVERARYGEVFLVVDNWNVLVHENEELEPAIAELVATGLHYGVHVVVSANRWNDIRLAVRDNIGGRLEFRLNDPLESEVDRQIAKLVADAVSGRGIMRGGELFQTALPSLTADLETGLRRGLEHVLASAAERWSARPAAPEIPLLPELVTAADLPDADAEGFAIGLEEYGLQPARLDLLGVDTHVLVLGDAESGKTSLLRGLAQRVCAGLTGDEVQVALFDYRRQLLDAVPETHLAGYACTPDTATELAERLAAQLRTRMPSPDIAPAELGMRRWWTGAELVVVVDDYDLVFAPTATPLQPLTELLAYGRDIGFHLVLARRVSGLVRSQFEPVVQRLRELGSTGLVLSGDPQEGPVLADVKATPQPPGRGVLVRNRRSVLVQTVHTPAAQTAPVTAEPVEVHL